MPRSGRPLRRGAVTGMTLARPPGPAPVPSGDVLFRLRTISVCLVLALLVGVPTVARAEVTITPAAREAFKKGVGLLRDKDGARYAEAYEAFQEAYEESPSSKILGNLGLCAMKLERDGEAIDAYERYLGDAGAVNKREHRQIVEDLVRLKAGSTAVELAIAPDEALVTDERLPAGGAPVINEYRVTEGRLETRLRQGRHRLRVEADGYETATWSFELKKGEPVEHRFELVSLASPEPDPPPLPETPDDGDEEGGFPSVGFIVAASATGVLGIATGIVGGLALSNKSSFDAAVSRGDTEEAEALRDKGQTLNGATDGLLVATGVAAAVTVVFLVLDLTSGDDEEEDPSEAALVLAPLAGPGHGGAAVWGAF